MKMTKYFKMDNTEGYTQSQLDELDELYDDLYDDDLYDNDVTLCDFCNQDSYDCETLGFCPKQ
jgi:hypothetical protein